MGYPAPTARVRPYVLTKGRTTAVADLPEGALLRATEIGTKGWAGLASERRAIILSCSSATSLKSVSHSIDLPVGVVRVLAVDLLAEGLLTTDDANTCTESIIPPTAFLERVLDGLRDL